MITRGIVEEVIDLYHYRVRLPLLDGAKTSKMSVKTSDLVVATVCTLPACSIPISVGDVVYVGFEAGGESKAFIMGYLYRDGIGNTRCDIDLRCLSVWGSAHLSEDTHIGEITPDEIRCLSGVSSNLQKQIDWLYKQINALQSDVNRLMQSKETEDA